MRSYLSIEQARFGDRIAAFIDMQAECADWPIPPLVIQPLVENAVKHGLGGRENGGWVRVEARRRSNALQLRVSDNGIGMPPDAGRRRSQQGPAIAIIWGWVPAMLWVFLVSIVMGAVHDFSALIISMRNQGKSLSEFTARYFNNRTKIFFFAIVFLELWIVIAIFGLVIAMALLVLGVLFSAFAGRLSIVAPAVQLNPAQTPPMWPFLFITIACGAISGFHSLVSSGTTSKQVRNEQDALFVGYGSMRMEGTLATLVIIAVAAGIGMGYADKSGALLTGTAAWTSHYASWASAKGLGSKITAFVVGSANMMSMLGIPQGICLVIMGVFVASFAGTTLDTATRVQRYVVAEPTHDLKLEALANKYSATFIAVGSALVLAFITGASGKGALTLWPLFGAVNQALAGLALIVTTLYLQRSGGLKWLVSGLPALFMSCMTIWALVLNQTKFLGSHNVLLEVINMLILVIAVWNLVEGVAKFFGHFGTASRHPHPAAV